MADIFLSYARPDVERAGQIAAALADHGWTVFWDTAILPGQRWRDVIHGELDSAGCVVVVWSESSSKSNWVVEEASEALEAGKLLPILVDSVDPPFGFRTVEAADLRTWTPRTVDHAGFEVLIDAISSLLGPPAPAPEQPAVPAPDEAGVASADPAADPAQPEKPGMPGVVAAPEPVASSDLEPVADAAIPTAAINDGADLLVPEPPEVPVDDAADTPDVLDPSPPAVRPKMFQDVESDGEGRRDPGPATDGEQRPAEMSPSSATRPSDARPAGAPRSRSDLDEVPPPAAGERGPVLPATPDDSPPEAPHVGAPEGSVAPPTTRTATGERERVSSPGIDRSWLLLGAATVVAVVLFLVFVWGGDGDDGTVPVPPQDEIGDAGGDGTGDVATDVTVDENDVAFAPDVVDSARLVAEPAPGPITIDGSTDDWVGVTTAYALQHEVSGPPTVDERLGNDSPGILAAAYDESALYVFVVVDDDVYSQPNQGNQIWRGDAVDININTAPAGEAPQQPDRRTFQLTMTPLSEPNGRPDNVLFVGNGEGFADNTTDLPVTISGSVEPGGRWILEAAIPWAVFGLGGPPDNSPVAALFSVFDNDGETSGGQSLQTVILGHLPGAAFQKDMSTWGRFDIER